MSKHEMSLFDALRIVEATPESLAIDNEELAILKSKNPRSLKAIGLVKDTFGIDAKVRK